MKLFFCEKCHDLVKLPQNGAAIYCQCKKSAGRYEDNINAVFYGKAIPVGITNLAFSDALKKWKSASEAGDVPKRGFRFDAFFIPDGTEVTSYGLMNQIRPVKKAKA